MVMVFLEEGGWKLGCKQRVDAESVDAGWLAANISAGRRSGTERRQQRQEVEASPPTHTHTHTFGRLATADLQVPEQLQHVDVHPVVGVQRGRRGEAGVKRMHCHISRPAAAALAVREVHGDGVAQAPAYHRPGLLKQQAVGACGLTAGVLP